MDARALREEPLASYAVPTVLIAAVVFALAFIPDPLQVLLPAVALGSGYFFRPRHVWVIWLTASLIVSIIFGVAWLLDYHPPKTADPGPATAVGIIVDTGLYFLYLAAAALVPLWLGRLIATRWARQRPPAR